MADYDNDYKDFEFREAYSHWEPIGWERCLKGTPKIHY